MAPLKMKAFKNRDDLDFGLVEQLKPLQEWDLLENSTGELEYQTK